jgi:hypothetical protein
MELQREQSGAEAYFEFGSTPSPCRPPPLIIRCCFASRLINNNDALLSQIWVIAKATVLRVRTHLSWLCMPPPYEGKLNRIVVYTYLPIVNPAATAPSSTHLYTH